MESLTTMIDVTLYEDMAVEHQDMHVYWSIDTYLQFEHITMQIGGQPTTLERCFDEGVLGETTHHDDLIQS